ncbi:Uncharacterized protein TPAR_03895 [Tolypocladium paradoxum]|uniref:Mid2 domain-containing protein n=1 Tax=Tolypocladium paradoxum TaxID=94208 RepID=A0A2S4L0H7_9HYPO|nr:Uncharacterized protein TPAR_03895 [Tolypocladium paradoxum]
MRLSLGLALGVLLGAAQAGKSSQSPTTPTSSRNTPTTTPTPTTAPPPNTGGGDTTVLVTRTVTGEVQTVTRLTTVFTTVTSTVVVTSTDFATTTVTSSDQATATKTVYETSTQFVNQKRGLDLELSPRTAAPAAFDAAAPVPTKTGVHDGAIGLQNHHLAKRATITQFTTVTVGAGNGGTTIVDSVVNTVKTVMTSATTTTSVVTETYQANAKTTVTVTSTLVVTSTKVTTGVVETSTGTPISTPGANNGGSSDSGGLSTGAKAGIGVGAGLGALAIIGVIAFFCMRRRRSPKPDHDDFMGASEVPVGGPASGGPGSRGSRPMSESAPAAGFLAAGRVPVKQSVSPEGYRGTAMGDGRAGYAKPAPFGSAYTQNPRNNVVGGDQLPRHPTPGDSSVASPTTPSTAELGIDGATAARWHNSNAAEIDSQPVMSHHSGPVYEMPTQEHR